MARGRGAAAAGIVVGMAGPAAAAGVGLSAGPTRSAGPRRAAAPRGAGGAGGAGRSRGARRSRGAGGSRRSGCSGAARGAPAPAGRAGGRVVLVAVERSGASRVGEVDETVAVIVLGVGADRERVHRWEVLAPGKVHGHAALRAVEEAAARTAGTRRDDGAEHPEGEYEQ